MIQHPIGLAASDHMVQIMLFWWAKEFDRFKDKAQITRITRYFLSFTFPSGVSLILLPTRIALTVPCDHLLQKAYHKPEKVTTANSKAENDTTANHKVEKVITANHSGKCTTANHKAENVITANHSSKCTTANHKAENVIIANHSGK